MITVTKIYIKFMTDVTISENYLFKHSIEPVFILFLITLYVGAIHV